MILFKSGNYALTYIFMLFDIVYCLFYNVTRLFVSISSKYSIAILDVTCGIILITIPIGLL